MSQEQLTLILYIVGLCISIGCLAIFVMKSQDKRWDAQKAKRINALNNHLKTREKELNGGFYIAPFNRLVFSSWGSRAVVEWNVKYGHYVGWVYVSDNEAWKFECDDETCVYSILKKYFRK